MPYIDALDGILTTRRGRWLITISAVAVTLFVLIDFANIHPFVWGNSPALYYFLIKPVIVGPTMVVVGWLAMRHTDAGDVTAAFTGALVGVVYLGLYYTLFPVRMTDGSAVQISLAGNMLEGVPIHFGAMAIAVLGAVWLERRLGAVE